MEKIAILHALIYLAILFTILTAGLVFVALHDRDK